MINFKIVTSTKAVLTLSLKSTPLAPPNVVAFAAHLNPPVALDHLLLKHHHVVGALAFNFPSVTVSSPGVGIETAEPISVTNTVELAGGAVQNLIPSTPSK